MDAANRNELLGRATELLRVGKWREAEAACTSVLSSSPGDVGALFLVAGAAHHSGDFGRAADLLGKCIAQDPTNAQFQLNRGDVLMRLGRLDESIAALQRAVELRPNLAAAHFHLGMALQSAWRRSEAQEAYTRFVQLSPNVAQAHYNLGVLAQDMRRPEYMAYYRRADISLDPFPYGGHTTGLDSLWMGVPMVTLEGGTIVSRAGVGMLHSLGLPELIARTAADYLRIAGELGKNLPRLRSLRRSLRDRMRASPLMDAQSFVRGFERICRDAWREWCAEGSPATATPATVI